jgi:hypothetical protein
MNASPPSLPEWHRVDRARFESEVIPANEPAILRGLAAHWPAVALGRESPMAIAPYLAGFDQGQPSAAVLLPPEEEGRLAYDAQMDGFNFMRTPRTVTQVLEQVLRYARLDNAPAVAMQSAKIAQCLPGFTVENTMPLLDARVEPRAWIGSAIITPAHFDESHNIAVCVAGRRRFTVFAPEQVANLYVGPLDNTPAGMPMSLVDFAKPDLERFPRFREAWANARTAELAPGDAIYLPPLWWHHVQSLERFNMLVNYWWRAAAPGRAVPPFTLDALMHAAATVGALPDAQREAWRHLFEHYVFGARGDVVGHIPLERQGALGAMSAEDHASLRKILSERLSR